MDFQTIKVFLSAIGEEEKESNLANENTEVVVQFENGEVYTASFFTYQNIEATRKEHQKNGDFLNGKYYWKERMVLIDFLSERNVHKVINELIDEGDFRNVFKKI